MKKITFLIFPLMVLAGCGDKNVDIVKDITLTDGAKLGYVLDNRKVCKSISWESYEDDRGRGRVKYTCIVSPENYQLFVQEKIPDYIEWRKNEVESLNNKISKMNEDDYQKSTIIKKMNQIDKSFSFQKVDEYKDIIEWVIPNNNESKIVPEKNAQYSCLKFDNNGVIFFRNIDDKGAPIYREHSNRFFNNMPGIILSIEFRNEAKVITFDKDCK